MTQLLLECEELTLTCPHCEAPVESLIIHREYELRFECPECYEDIQLVIGLEPG